MLERIRAELAARGSALVDGEALALGIEPQVRSILAEAIAARGPTRAQPAARMRCARTVTAGPRLRSIVANGCAHTGIERNERRRRGT